MQPVRHLLSILSLISAATLTACAGTATPVNLAATAELHCGRIASVTVVDDVLTIGAGEKPTPGYSVQLTEQTRKGDHLTVEYAISEPPQGAILAQMMTSPCSHISLPEDWQRLTVQNKTSGQQWVFERPEPEQQ